MRFQCPTCFQWYKVPPVTVAQIRAHMKDRHSKSVSTAWVNRRLKDGEGGP